MAPVLKTGIPERVSGVRIPPSPPVSQSTGFTKYFATVCPTRHNRLVFFRTTGVQNVTHALQSTINAFHSGARTDSGSVAAVCSVTSLAAVRAFAPVAASVAGGAALAAAFSLHRRSVTPAASGPDPAAVGVSGSPAPASRVVFPAVAGISGPVVGFPCLEERGTEPAEPHACPRNRARCLQVHSSLLNVVLHDYAAFLREPNSLWRNCRKFVGDGELDTCHSGKTELTALPRDMFTDLYAATATLWKVEVTASNV